ncbi:L,D-transpeptidase catalytic domain [Paracoccus halophilus]|uniref:ErfK/YbiS/YcfS/YnhG family protein n=1 Tax=Paracoccus halophilus TaxID=376733 RepID=A0A099F5Y9_9RHOB|nr:L,D-transpeptidase family protein [Paracoccus halophilus]KGJ06150.1 ErfK/YbiS/YcfS/YnhG family protein [Paracoccus halophilus]SFA46034.1 L,D-transpeptidase catalytic domain [Paracoccus halophilus]
MIVWLGRSFAIALILGLAACAPRDSKFKTYSGPEVTQVVVNKGARQLLLYNGETVLKAYRIGLGNEPVGDKQFEGDGKTPEGNFIIDRRNPNSQYHLSVGIDYPQPEDIAAAAAVGRNPGSDIFVHGLGPEGRVLSKQEQDWTAGCIAVTDDEIEEIYAMVKDGTPILITP